MKKGTILLTFCLLATGSLSAKTASLSFKGKSKSITVITPEQTEGKEYKGVPDDLDQNKLLFLLIDSAFVEEEKPKETEARTRWRIKKMHNSYVPRANKELQNTAPDYPFDYKIIRRSELKSHTIENYKYALDFKPFVDAQNGIRHAGQDEIVKFPFYILDRTTNDIYILSYVSENFVYKYGGLLNKYLLRAVKSSYKSKLK